ncbi:MAG: hypothetical protein D8H91_06605 [Alloprevotella sp.]|nr:MAG: hypothetical protein D8H91_06605 [Alloprevotella sp.]
MKGASRVALSRVVHSLSVCDCKGTTFSSNLQMFWRFFSRKVHFSLFFPLKWGVFRRKQPEKVVLEREHRLSFWWMLR